MGPYVHSYGHNAARNVEMEVNTRTLERSRTKSLLVRDPFKKRNVFACVHKLPPVPIRPPPELVQQILLAKFLFRPS